MATSATEVFKENPECFDKETRSYIERGDNPLDFKNLIFTKTTEDSKRLNTNKEPKIIISASGMCEAGRIRHHLRHNLADKKNTVIFVGYQAEYTLGRRLLEGAESVNLFGEEVPVNAEIVDLEGFSAHADRDALAEWISSFTSNPKVFLVHGEQEAKKDFAEYIKEKFGIKAVVIEKNSEFEL